MGLLWYKFDFEVVVGCVVHSLVLLLMVWKQSNRAPVRGLEKSVDVVVLTTAILQGRL